jgi:uncharacterized protein DUF4124
VDGHATYSRLCVILIFFALLFFPLNATAQIKQWTDEQGVTHFGNEPQTPQGQNPYNPPLKLEARKSKPFTVPERASMMELRKAGEIYLKDLSSSLLRAQAQMEIINLEYRKLAIGTSGERLIRLESEAKRTRLEAYGKLFGPIKADLVDFENKIKERGAGSLPDWVRDNRDWRALDKEFAP